MPLYSFYVEPGVYVRTIRELSGSVIPGTLRLPVLIGEGSETIPVSGKQMIRALSSSVDNYAKNEVVTDRFLTDTNAYSEPDSTLRRFRVHNVPVVSGNGKGVPTKDPGHVTVLINGIPATVLKIEPETGIIHLSQLPTAGDVVTISYYYDIRDTKITEEDLSYQVNGSRTTFKVNHPRIVIGDNGGETATATSSITVKVDGVKATVSSLNGSLGTFTLASAPTAGSQVLVTYYSNNLENTSDPFEDANIANIFRVGNNPGKLDYVNENDYVLQEDQIVWGHAALIKTGETTPDAGAVLFDSSQITTTLIDNKTYFEQLTGTVDGFNRAFSCKFDAVEGNGRGAITDDVSKIAVYVGSTLSNALAAGPVVVDELYGADNRIVLHTAPSSPNKVYMTYAYNILLDASYEFVNKVADVSGSGEYVINSPEFGVIPKVMQGNDDGGHVVADAADFLSAGGIIFPYNASDLQSLPGVSVNENVTVTFTSSTAFTVTSDNALGSTGTGSINQTYIDNKTGLRFTVLDPATADDVQPGTSASPVYSYAAGDILRFKVTLTENFVADSGEEILQVPGLRVIVSNTSDIPVNDSAIVSTYNKNGREPNVGALYYVDYEYEKTDFSTIPVANEAEVTIVSGPINLANRLSLAARIALRNGAIRLGLKQVVRAPGQPTATSASYVEAIDEQKILLANNRNQDVIVPLTGDPDVMGFLKAHVETQSSEFYNNRRVGIVGFNLGTTPDTAISTLKSLNSERIWGVYPDGVILSYVDESGREIESAVDGCFLAAAISGLISAPNFDSATPLVGRDLVDFKRLTRRLDRNTTADVITAGSILVKDVGTAIRIVDAYTTRYGDLLYEEPNVTLIDDEIARDGQRALQRFVGLKSLGNITQEISRAISNLMSAKVRQQIISDYKDVNVSIDSNDPRIGRVSVAYKPVFALKWIQLTLHVRSTL